LPLFAAATEIEPARDELAPGPQPAPVRLRVGAPPAPPVPAPGQVGQNDGVTRPVPEILLWPLVYRANV
jgi:hypothetical protein